MAIDTVKFIQHQVHISSTWSRKWFEECGNLIHLDHAGKHQPCALSAKDRSLLCFMFDANHSTAAIERTFRQKKYVVYFVVKFIMQQIVCKLGRKWLSLIDAGSTTSSELIGQRICLEEG